MSSIRNALVAQSSRIRLAIVLLIASPLTAPARGEPTSISPHDWRMYNYNVLGTRHNTGEDRLSPRNVAGLERKWRFPREGSQKTVGVIHATPSVVNGYVYFGTATHPTFYKLTPDGQVKWSYRIGGAMNRLLRRATSSMGLVPADGVYSSALVTEDSVYFGDALGVLYCLDRKTGTEKWNVNSKSKDFPGAHQANLIIASPIPVGDLIVVGGGAYEHALPAVPLYRCCRGRGFVIAIHASDGRIAWKYDVGPEPRKFEPPIRMQSAWGERVFHYGPSTSSVWSTPSFDESTGTIFFGTDIHNSPRKPTDDDPRNYTPHSAAVIAVDVRDGSEKWVTQITEGDVWNHTMPSYDPETGYKDQSIGDTPKIYTITQNGDSVRVVGVGSKNGGFYVLRVDNGKILHHTPIYTGPPVPDPDVDPRTLALPNAIGGLQTGCATDGHAVYTNGIDALVRGTAAVPGMDLLAPPTAGRVTSIGLDTRTENWRHERPKVAAVGGTPEKPAFTNVGDPVASGIAVANGVVFFTTFTSNRLVALQASSGQVLKEIGIGPVLAGPSVSRGRVYIGTGNTQFVPKPVEDYFPKSNTGVLYSFGLPGEDDVSRMGGGLE